MNFFYFRRIFFSSLSVFLCIAFAKTSVAQTVIDIQPNGQNRRFNLEVVRKTIATFDKMTPSTIVRCNSPIVTGLNRKVQDGEEIQNLVFLSATYTKDNLETLEPQWIVDTNRVVIGAVFEVKNNYSFEFIEADPNTEEVLQYLDQPGDGVLQGVDFEKSNLSVTNIRPYNSTGAVRVLGYKLENGQALHALMKSDSKEYRKALAQTKLKYKGTYENLDALKEKRAVERTANALNRFVKQGDFVAVETFDGEKIKKLNIAAQEAADLPLYLSAYVLDEYNGLRYPATVGFYKKDDKPSAPGMVTYMWWSSGKQAAHQLADILGDDRPIYMTSNIGGVTTDLDSEVKGKINIRLSAPYTTKHAPMVASQLAATGKVKLLLDWMDWKTYRKTTSKGEAERLGAQYLVYNEAGQYGVTDVESDRKLGLTENISSNPSELFEMLSDRLDLGERVLRVTEEKKGKVKSFLYYQPLGSANREIGDFVDIYVEHFETVDGKKIARMEPVGSAFAKRDMCMSNIRTINVRKGEKEVADAITKGERILLRKAGFKFFGKEYK